MFKAFLEQAGLEEQKHQFEAVDWCLKNETQGNETQGNEKKVHGGIIADEMGLGKTIQLAGTMYCNELPHTLIVLPKALLDQWTKVIKKMLKQRPLIYHGIWKKDTTLDHLYSYPVVITTYGMISENKKETQIEKSLIHKVEWSRIIFDEAHHMRNKKTNIFKGASKLKSKIKWLVTGTPIQNKREDLYSLCALLGLPTKYYTTPSNIPELCEKFILHRTKESTGLKLPALKIHTINVPWSNIPENKLSEDIHSCFNFSNINIKTLDTPFSSDCILVLLLRAKQTCILPRLLNGKYEQHCKDFGDDITSSDEMSHEQIKEALKSSSKMNIVIQTILERKSNGKSKLIFCHFRGEIDYLEEILISNGLTTESFDGRTSEKQRNLILTSKNLDVLILQIQTGCEGLNLQQFSEVYFISPHWNPAIEDQAIARCHRFGQKEDVEVFRFNMDGFDDKHESSALDCYVENVQQRKRLLMNMIQ